MYIPWRRDKCWVENLLSLWTPVLLAFLAVTSLVLRYVRDPISCHYIYPQASDYFTGYCFQETSLLLRSDEFVEFSKQFWEKSHNLRGRVRPNPYDLWPKQRTSHQWVPFALGLAAILSLLPLVIWRILTAFLWIDNHTLVQTIADSQSQSSGRHVTVKDSALVVRAGLQGSNWVLSAAALARKVVGCVVCFLQVVLIVAWFKPPLAGEPEKVTRDLSDVNVTVPEAPLEDVPLPVDPFFCVVDTSQHRNIQSMTIQCLLPLNKVFIKGFLFLFYFFLFLLVLCVGDVFYWLGRLFLPHLRDVTLLRNLSVINQSEDGKFGRDPVQFSPFLQFLGPDGRLMVALVADHCGAVAGLHFTSQLWQAFHGRLSLQEGGSTTTAPVSPSSVGGSVVVKEEGEAAGNSRAAHDIPMQDMGEGSHYTDKDTAQLWSE